MTIAVLILTYNEEVHIERLLKNIRPIATEIYVVDSGSTDKTIEICKNFSVKTFYNPFESHSSQVNWAIENCGISEQWIIRLDADEYLLPDLREEIFRVLNSDIGAEVNGFFLRRRNIFMGKWIRHGGYYPVRILRMWRTGFAECDGRYMDEHMVLKSGISSELRGDFVDHNLKPVSWWIEKHNWYATKEAAEIIWREADIRHGKNSASEHPELEKTSSRSVPLRVKLFKWYGYNNLWLIFRCVLYFTYRYFFRLGFLDGTRGFIFHFLQALWYRILVDVKVLEINRHASAVKVSRSEALYRLHGLEQ